MSIAENFPGNDPRELFANEKLLLEHSMALRAYARQILKERNLPSSVIAYDWFIDLKSGKKRKDKITPSEQHEQSHIVNADSLLTSLGDKAKWDEQKYGTQDQFFLAIILHDVLEDDGYTPQSLMAALQEKIEDEWSKPASERTISKEMREKMHRDLAKAIEVVGILSRNQPLADGSMPDRTEQTNKILHHPFAVIIKQIDWTHKLATMIGVDAFEIDNQKRMRRNLNETSEIFDRQRGALPQRAGNIYPSFKKMIDILHANMAMTYNIVDGYANRCDPDYEGSPSKEPPYNFKEQVELTKPMTECLPKGLCMPWVAQERVRLAGVDRDMNPEIPPEKRGIIHDFHDYVLTPALVSLFHPAPKWNIKNLFTGAVKACKSLLPHTPAAESPGSNLN